MTARFLIGIVAVTLVPLHVSAAEPVTCLQTVYDQLGQEQRLYRSVIFGMAEPEDMPVNATLTDKDGDQWMKTGNNEWKSYDHTGLTWSDTLMKNQMDVPPRRGLMEVRQALSSELIPPVLQAVRATRCRMTAVCDAALKAPGVPADKETVKVQPEGCIEFEMDVPDTCRVPQLTAFDQGVCDAQVKTVMDREIKMLELLFAYDASYRTLMQFAGTFEGFLADFRFPLLQPLWQMVRTLGQFDKLPCFLAECNE